MGYKFQDELTKRAEQFIASLRQAEIVGAIVPNSFRDYTIKVSIRKAGQFFGNANLFYSPTKERFSLKTHELKDASIVPDLESCWDRIDTVVSTQNGGSTNDLHAGNQIYVDGSFIEGKFGYAFVVLQDGVVAHEQFGQVEDDWLLDMRQVGGEIKAVLEAIAWCQDHGIKETAIFYDYAGIEQWATGRWTASKPATKRYVRSAEAWPVVVLWHKVASHSGDRWNDHVDRLAGRAARGGQPSVDPTAEIKEKALEFTRYLKAHGIVSSSTGIINGQFIRMDFDVMGGKMDLYNTKSRPLAKPYLHDFPDAASQHRVERLWQEFFNGPVATSRTVDPLAEATYHFEIVKPYQDCNFDFVDFADALKRAFRALDTPYPLEEVARYDFSALHHTFKMLQKEPI